MSEEVNARLESDPVQVECPICRHRQWLDSAEGRCDQCGSEIEIHSDRESARAALDALLEEGRVAYLNAVSGSGPRPELWVVVANRAFGSPRKR